MRTNILIYAGLGIGLLYLWRKAQAAVTGPITPENPVPDAGMQPEVKPGDTNPPYGYDVASRDPERVYTATPLPIREVGKTWQDAGIL